MAPADRILEILYDRAGEYVWRDELASAAGEDQARVEAALEALARRGHRFEQSPGRGVRMLRPTVLDAHLVERGLGTTSIGRHVLCFPEVASTNDVAFDSAQQAGDEALVITAEHQRAGRGRRGRRWVCPSGAGILASVLLAESGVAPAADALTIAAGLAVAEGLEEAAAVAARLEWPNDVVVAEAKLAGVLVETRAIGPRRRTVIGFGINVTACPPAGEIGRKATCLYDLGAPADLERIEVLRAVLTRLDVWVAAAGEREFGPLHDRWIARCDMLNRRVVVRTDSGLLAGRILDVSPLSGLVLQTDEGRQVHLPAAGAALET